MNFPQKLHKMFEITENSKIIRGGSRIPRRMGANLRGGSANILFTKFSEKLHENENILGRGLGGVRTGRAPPLRDATFQGLKGLLVINSFAFTRVINIIDNRSNITYLNRDNSICYI